MAIPKELPNLPLNYAGMMAEVALAGGSEGEMMFALEGDSRYFDGSLKKLLDAITGGQLEIDGKIVRSRVLHRQGDDKTVFYLDWTGQTCGAEVRKELELECWDAVNDGLHNSNSHLIFWRGDFYLIHASSPYHFATPECKLVLWRSKDARSWEQVATFSVADEDIRDPKFAVIHDRLFIYVLKSLVEDGSEPYTTAYTYTDDGVSFAPLTELLDNHGWLFWNPKTRDNETWYVPAYWGGHGNSVLMKTTNGMDFKIVSYIHRGKYGQENDRNDETDFEFFDDGTMISTQRLEFSEDVMGDKEASTNITMSAPPYTEWRELGRDFHTRLDGPSLFNYNGRIYAVGRRNPYEPDGRNFVGSGFGKKRTSLYEVTPKGLIFLSDFPSAGDTSYGGCVLKDGYLYASYYSSTLESDWPWYVGMLSPSDIKMVRLPLDKMEALADRIKAEYERDNKYKLKVAED